MSKILLIETATKVCSIGISVNGQRISIRENDEQKSCSQVITVMIEEVMKESTIKLSELDAVAVSCGPGSYTGLRIGISTAKGICYGLNKPLISINTLEVLANGFKINGKNEAMLCPLIDAKRNESYVAIYGRNLNQIIPPHPEIFNENSFEELLNKTMVYFFGDGSSKLKGIIKNHKNAIFEGPEYPSVAFMASSVEKKFCLNQFEDVAYFEPFYLKEFKSIRPPISLNI